MMRSVSTPRVRNPQSLYTRFVRSILQKTAAQTTHRVQQQNRFYSSGNPASATESLTTAAPSRVVRPLVPPPDVRHGPLLTRRADRALPELENSRTTWLKTLPIFIALITISSLAIFNYQKSSSSTVNSILYALRTNETARELLGDEIYFASRIPWISGELNQLHGNINISFWVKGTKTTAETKFVSVRTKRDAYFETIEWSLKMQDGRTIQLLELDGTRDPMASVVKE